MPRQFPTPQASVVVGPGKINTVLHLRNGGELIIPLGSLPAGVRVEANYGEPPKVSWSRFRPIGEQVHFSVLPKTTFAEPLLLEYRVPPGVYRDAAKYGYFEVATLDTQNHRWNEVATSYDPTSHMVVTQISHFSWWSATEDAVKDAQIVAECIPDAFTWGHFLECLIEKGLEEEGNSLVTRVLTDLMPKTCLSDLIATGAIDHNVLSIYAAAADDPACVGTAVSNGLPQPTVTSVSPDSGSTAGGEILILSGQTIGSATQVKFGTVNAAFTYPLNSPNSLSVTTPSHPAGVVNITVSDAGGTSNPAAGNQFTYVAPPTPPTTSTPPVSSPSGSTGATYSETPGGVHTWTNYSDAGGTEGPTIPSNETIQVSCRIQGFTVADGDTWWYLVASSPWNDRDYGSADAFYNDGSTSGTLAGTPYYDPNVPVCG